MTYLIFLFLAYLLGSIPFGFLTGRIVKGIDVREHGSKNIGATNVFRVVGKKWGIVVFLLDAFKGYIAVRLPDFLGNDLSLPSLIGLAIAAILGHTFPVRLRFKGGKGVATSLGVFLAVAPLQAGITFALWCVIFFSFRILSAASLAAALFFPAVVFLTFKNDPDFPWLFSISLLLTGFIFMTHRANIQRLLRQEEKRLF